MTNTHPGGHPLLHEPLTSELYDRILATPGADRPTVQGVDNIIQGHVETFRDMYGHAPNLASIDWPLEEITAWTLQTSGIDPE